MWEVDIFGRICSDLVEVGNETMKLYYDFGMVRGNCVITLGDFIPFLFQILAVYHLL